jgi:hypothetical protein
MFSFFNTFNCFWNCCKGHNDDILDKQEDSISHCSSCASCDSKSKSSFETLKEKIVIILKRKG